MAGRFTKLLHQVMSVSCGVSADSDGLNTGCNTQCCVLLFALVHLQTAINLSKICLHALLERFDADSYWTSGSIVAIG